MARSLFGELGMFTYGRVKESTNKESAPLTTPKQEEDHTKMAEESPNEESAPLTTPKPTFEASAGGVT